MIGSLGAATISFLSGVLSRFREKYPLVDALSNDRFVFAFFKPTTLPEFQSGNDVLSALTKITAWNLMVHAT
jgi:hypothetical protein